MIMLWCGFGMLAGEGEGRHWVTESQLGAPRVGTGALIAWFQVQGL